MSGRWAFRRQRQTAPGDALGACITPRNRTQSVGPSAAALGLPTAFRCIALLSQTVGQLRIKQYRAEGTVRVPLAEWIRRPDAYGSPARRRELMTAAVTAMAGWGAAYWRATPGGSSSWAMEPIAPARVTVQFDGLTYRRVWSVDGRKVDVANGPARIPGLVVAPYLLLPDHPEPVGPLGALRLAAAGYLDVEAYAARVFRSGMHAGQRLETDQDLPAASAQRWQDAWMAAHADPAESKIPVLGGGLRLTSDAINPADAQWLESRTFNAQEIARVFGVPARMLGLPAGDSITYATARDNDNDFNRYTLLGYADPIEESWSSLLPPGRNEAEDQAVAFDFDGLMRPTLVDRWSAYNGAVQAGWLTADDARTAEGMDPLPDPASAPSGSAPTLTVVAP